MTISLLLLTLAFACFVLAAVLMRPDAGIWGRIVTLGFACWVLSLILAGR
jgi:hypothetical protein